MAPRSILVRLLPAAALALSLTACDSGGEDGELVGGVNVTKLFAAPTADEMVVIKADWEGRNVTAQNDAIVREFTYTAAASASGPFIPYNVTIVSHQVPIPATQGGGLATHYGAIMRPVGLSGTAALMVYNHGGDKGVSLAEAGLFAASLTPGTSTKKPIIWVVPSFRSEKLRWAPNGVPGTSVTAADSVTSTGPASPWDYDVDDAIALVNVAIKRYGSQIDQSKIGVMGVSRGGNVALQMGIRDTRVKRVVDIFGPTNFLSEWVQGITKKALNGETVALPGFDALNASLIQPLKAGTLTIAQVRNQIIRRSPLYFTSDLTEPVLIHHGDADQTVLVSESDVLAQKFGAAAQTTYTGATLGTYTYFRWVGGVHDPRSFQPANQWAGATQMFINAL